MGGLTTPKKSSSLRARHKALKCTVQLKLHAITWPEILIPPPEYVYLSARLMGKHRKTKYVPLSCPILLHEVMVFTKIFSGAVDPGDIADDLKNDTTCLELIQLVPPDSEILATFEGNTKDFLYPGPKLIPQTPGSKRQILMKKCNLFPGISPKVEFSTMSVIEECNLKGGQSAIATCSPSTYKPCHGRPRPTAARRSNQITSSACGYQRPTVASLSRSPSPYTHRKMCQLSENATKRLQHFQLGPYTFKKETVSQPPFVVPHSPNSSLIESSSAVPSSPERISFNQTSAREHSLSFMSPERRTLPGKTPAYYSTPVSSTLRDQSPLLTRSTLRERFQSLSTLSKCDEIHNRVQRILHTHVPRCKLSFNEHRMSEEQESGQNEPHPSRHESMCESWLQLDRVIPGEPSVKVDNQTFWLNKAAKNTGMPHRAVFEDILGKMYKNLYRKANFRQ